MKRRQRSSKVRGYWGSLLDTVQRPKYLETPQTLSWQGPHPWGRPSLAPTQQSLKSISSESHTEMGFGGWILPSQGDLGNPLGFPQTLSSTTQNQTSASSFTSASTCTADYRTSINSSKRGNRTEGPYISCTMSGLQSNLPDTQRSKVTWPIVNRNQPWQTPNFIFSRDSL